MYNPEALAWSRKIFGEPGPYVRELVPELLASTHGHYVALQRQSGLSDGSPYGLIWLGMPQAFVNGLCGTAGFQLYRPRRGRYELPLINGVPVIPWRYARDGKTDVKGVPFGRPPSETRKSMFYLPDLAPVLPFGEEGLGDAVLDELSPENRILVDQFGEDIRCLAAEGMVAVAAYASNPDALLNGWFGYAKLGVGNLLEWTYKERLSVRAGTEPVPRDVTSTSPGTAFDSGPLEAMTLRRRTPGEMQVLNGGAPRPDGTGIDE